MRKYSKLILFSLVILIAAIQRNIAVPVENENAIVATVSTDATTAASITNETHAAAAVAIENAQTDQDDLQTSASDEKPNIAIPTNAGTVLIPDNIPTTNNFDPSIYAGLLTPDVFQQYVNQYSNAFPPPFPGPPYPGPMGYVNTPAGQMYPTPYVVQTGYEGLLVPTTRDAAQNQYDNDITTTANEQFNLMKLFNNYVPRVVVTTILRIVAVILTALGVVLFSGAITSAICNLTPFCEISFKAIELFKRRGAAETVGRMLVENMTPERVRRTTEFVQNAIRKYRKLQKTMQTDDDGDFGVADKHDE